MKAGYYLLESTSGDKYIVNVAKESPFLRITNVFDFQWFEVGKVQVYFSKGLFHTSNGLPLKVVQEL